MAHLHSIYDCDTHFVIDLKTREIKNDIGKTVIVQNDHNSERFSFELPKMIEGHDMSLCNVVQVHYVNVDSKTKEQHEGLYAVDDLQISPDSDDVVILSWLLSQEATRAVGSLYFGIVFKCIEEDGTLTYSWHTTVNKDFKVVESLDHSNVILEEYPDILAQFEERLTAVEQNGGGSGGKGINNMFVSSQDIPLEGETSEVKITVNYTDGTKENLDFLVPHGKDYILTDDDKAEIAEQAAELVEVPEGGTVPNVPTTSTRFGSFIHISFDDVTLCIQNLISKTYTSVFEEPFFAWLKSLNEQYGAKFSLYVMNISNLANVPDKYKNEFLAAKDWLKFGLHSNTANSTYVNSTYATGATDWNIFVSQIIRITGTFETVDRVPRLHYFYGSKEALQGMRDCDCGALGFLSADDSRQSYYLDTTQNAFLKNHDSIIDFENGLLFYNTDFRGDWFKSGFTSENTYNVPIKSNVYDELLYRFGLAKYADTFKSFIYFCHEWQFYNGTVVNENKVWTEDICRFGNDYNIPFDYPQNRIDINPTSFKFLSVNNGSNSGDNGESGGTTDSGEYLFNDFANFVYGNNNTRIRANHINENFTFKENDIISIGDYNTYSLAVGSGDKNDDSSGFDNWFGNGYVTSDFVLTAEQAQTVTQLNIKRNDGATMTDTDLHYIRTNAKVIRN